MSEARRRTVSSDPPGTRFVYDETYASPLDEAVETAIGLRLAVYGLQPGLALLTDEWHAVCALCETLEKHLRAALEERLGPETAEREALLQRLKDAMERGAR